MIIEINGKRVEVDKSFADLSPEEQQEQINMIASQIEEGAASSEASDKMADMLPPVGGLAIGTLTGAVTGPYAGKVVDTAATKVAEKVAGPKGTPRGDKVAKWLATQTTGPNVGGATFEEAYRKSEIARGKPVQSRGSQVPIRKGFLGVQNQPAEPSMSQKAAANIMAKEKLGVPSVPRRIGGMGVAGAETGKMISDFEQGNYGDAALSGVGALGGVMSQSRIPPIRAIGTGISTIIPSIQGYRAAKETFYPSVLEEKKKEEEKPEMAKGGRVGALTELINYIKNKGGTSEAKRLERAADLVPNLERQYQPEALKSALIGDNARALMVMKPGDFEKYAYPISAETKMSSFPVYGIGKPSTFESYDAMPKGTYQDYVDYLSKFAQPGGGGFSSVPFLQLGQNTRIPFPSIMGHEGRHRTAALEKLGDEATLVQMLPRASMREQFPRRSQEEYLEALTEKVGKKPFVQPERGYDEKEKARNLIQMPELFKEGGSTTPAWQRKEGKNPEGGLNALGRASYNRETGGNLKAPQPEGGSRKKSFCARMGGMKKKLTSSKTANDPDSRINKALRKWKC